jgi:hypothetical protein
MRKADYSYLAFLINHQLTRARQIRADKAGNQHDDTCALGAIAELKNLAVEFANGASVDKTEFLKACGID